MSILQMSISAGVLIIAIIIIRALTLNRLPKKMFLALWCIALFRLLVPFSFSSRFSFYSMITELLKLRPSESISPIIGTFLYRGIPTSETMRTVEQIEPLTHTQGVRVSPLTIIWFIGMLAMIIFFTIIYIKNYKELSCSLQIRDNEFLNEWILEHKILRNIRIMQSDRIKTPLTTGIMKPRIILPKYMSMKNTPILQYILQHEYYHIRRFDMLWKLLLIAALCVHWFNPMVWVMFFMVNRDLEITCDEMVIRHFGQETKSAYAYSLIGMAEQQKKFTPLYNSFSKNAIEERIMSIMKSRKTSLVGGILACMLVIGTTTVFVTNAAASSNSSTLNNNSLNKTYPETEIGTVISTKDSSGKVRISTDNGEIWMNEEEYEKSFPSPEWWTYDEYKEWIENEKIQLQDTIGDKAWNPTDGWYVMNQEKIDGTIQMYESILDDIKHGMKVSKPADGSDQVMLSYSPSDIATTIGYELTIVNDKGEEVTFGPFETKEELLAQVRPYCEQQVKEGTMTQKVANDILSKYN